MSGQSITLEAEEQLAAHVTFGGHVGWNLRYSESLKGTKGTYFLGFEAETASEAAGVPFYSHHQVHTILASEIEAELTRLDATECRHNGVI